MKGIFLMMPETNRNALVFRIVLVTLLCTQASLLALLAWSTSPNRTEVGHIGAATYLWRVGKFDVFHVNPPLIRVIAGTPVALFCNPNYDWKPYSPRPRDRSEWRLGTTFIGANNLDDLRLYIFLMRLACIPLILLGGYFGYRFASELYGAWSGIMFLVLWTFSPLILGWGATICPDVAGASMGIVGLYTFWHWLKTPTWGKAAIAGICLGLMTLTKMTWIVAFPIWGVLFVVWQMSKSRNEAQRNDGSVQFQSANAVPEQAHFTPRPSLRVAPFRLLFTPSFQQFAAMLLLAVWVINAGYLFDGSFKQLKDYQFISGTLTGTAITKGTPVKLGNRFADSWMGHIPVPLPKEFVQGIDTQKIDFERGMDSYARGVWSDRGWWWYYGYVLLLREPLGVWGLLFLALFVSCVFCNANASWRDELTVLIPMLSIFAFISSQDGFSINPRYVVFVLPLLYIFISKIASSSATVCRLRIRWLSAVCLAWVVVSSLSFYPYSMSYFNELAGKPKNYPQYLLGSNIDWGQDAYTLKAWVEKHPEATPLYISYSTPILLEKLGIRPEPGQAVGYAPIQPPSVVGLDESSSDISNQFQYNGAVPTEPTTGWMIVGVNELFRRDGKLDWLKDKEPQKMIGYSIYLYHMTSENVEQFNNRME